MEKVSLYSNMLSYTSFIKYIAMALKHYNTLYQSHSVEATGLTVQSKATVNRCYCTS